MATALHRRILNACDYVPYSLEGTGTSALSTCDVFLTDEEEYVPAFYVNQHANADERLTDYERYVANCEELGATDIKDALDRMIVCDDIIANYDRHWRNLWPCAKRKHASLQTSPHLRFGLITLVQHITRRA